MTFGLGAGIAGLAGVALSQIDNVSPNLGQTYIVDSFMVVVFGGAGNIWGTLAGAFTLGIANKFLEPYAGAVLAKIIVLIFIILFIQKRPRGLFAAARPGGGRMSRRALAIGFPSPSALRAADRRARQRRLRPAAGRARCGRGRRTGLFRRAQVRGSAHTDVIPRPGLCMA